MKDTTRTAFQRIVAKARFSPFQKKQKSSTSTSPTTPATPYRQAFRRRKHECADSVEAYAFSLTNEKGVDIVEIINEEDYFRQPQQLDGKLRDLTADSSILNSSSSSTFRSRQKPGFDEIRLTRTVCPACRQVFRILRENSNDDWHLINSAVSGPSWFEETSGTKETNKRVQDAAARERARQYRMRH